MRAVQLRCTGQCQNHTDRQSKHLNATRMQRIHAMLKCFSEQDRILSLGMTGSLVSSKPPKPTQLPFGQNSFITRWVHPETKAAATASLWVTTLLDGFWVRYAVCEVHRPDRHARRPIPCRAEATW